MKHLLFSIFLACLFISCANDTETEIQDDDTSLDEYQAVIDNYLDINLSSLDDYSSSTAPDYIAKDNTIENEISNEGATLGRVLFYDVNLSSDNTVACATCHQQAFAFTDDHLLSNGVNGKTGRHSMRIVNARFSEEEKFFWDERASSLEEQSTMPIQDHTEMGFSGENGDGDLNDLITKLEGLEYYNVLFEFVYGDNEITEVRIQNALAQFERSIESFDSKYDVGRELTTTDVAPFPNFTTEENNGKRLFFERPTFNDVGERIDGGFGCAGCHRAPEFDIDPNSMSNGVVSLFDDLSSADDIDVEVTRSPSLRDIINPDGTLNGGFAMHHGGFVSMEEVLEHYNNIPDFSATPELIAQIDQRLLPNGYSQKLNMTQQEIDEVISFLQTLTGNTLYSEDKWSSPFK